MIKILIIEQDSQALENTSAFLNNQGFEVYTSNDAKVGIITAIRVVPDLIISSLSHENSNEFDVCKALKKIPATSFIPIIYITTEPQEILAGMQLGADGFLSKPLRYSQMLSTIKSHLSSSHARVPVYTNR